LDPQIGTEISPGCWFCPGCPRTKSIGESNTLLAIEAGTRLC
jgi:hypothetical protein